jgi:hypothetical protein
MLIQPAPQKKPEETTNPVCFADQNILLIIERPIIGCTMPGLFIPQAQGCRYSTSGFIIVYDKFPQFGGGLIFNNIPQPFNLGFPLGIFCRFFSSPGFHTKKYRTSPNLLNSC